MKSHRLQRMLVTSASSLLAVFVALCICAVILLISGKDPIEAYRTLFGAAGETKVLQGALNRATPLMISAAAVAIGFKMNLFNIGVEGQMRVALLATAVAGAAVDSNDRLGFSTVAVVPEPSTYAMLALAGAGFAGYVIRRRRR